MENKRLGIRRFEFVTLLGVVATGMYSGVVWGAHPNPGAVPLGPGISAPHENRGHPNPGAEPLGNGFSNDDYYSSGSSSSYSGGTDYYWESSVDVCTPAAQETNVAAVDRV